MARSTNWRPNSPTLPETMSNVRGPQSEGCGNPASCRSRKCSLNELARLTRHSWFIPVLRQPNGLLKWQSIFWLFWARSTCWVCLCIEWGWCVGSVGCVEMRWWWSSRKSATRSLPQRHLTPSVESETRFLCGRLPIHFFGYQKSRRGWHLWLRQYVFYMPYFCTNHLTLSIVVIYLSLPQFPTHTHTQPNTIKHIEIQATLFVRSSKL